jgi:nucleotide-binding universal stress UspA family protein
VGNRRVRAKLDSRLARWTHRYPELHVESAVLHGDLLAYLAKNAVDAQLLVMGARHRHHVTELVGPGGNAALRDTDCPILIVDRLHL